MNLWEKPNLLTYTRCPQALHLHILVLVPFLLKPKVSAGVCKPMCRFVHL